MKHRIIVAAASLVLAALILLLLPMAPPQTAPSTTPSITTRPTEEPTLPTVPPTTFPPEPAGVVRLYICDPEIWEVLTEMAAEYTAETGTEVILLTQEEDGCQATLQRLMVSEDPPTAFCVHSRSQLLSWESTLLELKDTPLASLLRSEDMAIRHDGKWLAIPMGLKAYGLLLNAELLATKGALSRLDIADFPSLSTAVQILKNNSVKAFPTLNLTAEDAWHLLAVQEPEHTREFLDLYLSNCNKSGDALTQFLEGKAAFLPGGSWDYGTLANHTDKAFHVRNLDIVPTYIGNAMQYLCDTAWVINAGSRQHDMDATLSFLCWMATATENSTAPIDRLQLLTPFAGGNYYGNQLEKKLLGYMSTEPAVTDFDDAPEEDETLLTALNAYLQAPNDENWEQLRLYLDKIRTQPIPETNEKENEP